MRSLFSDISDHKLCTERLLAVGIDKVYRFFGLYQCFACDRYPFTLCDTCREDFRYAVPLCSICGKFSNNGRTHPCCCTSKRFFDYSAALFDYTKVVKSLFREYKYKLSFQYQRVLEELLCKTLTVDPFVAIRSLKLTHKSTILLLPVPMSPWKLEERGFSPAYEISVMLGRYLQKNYGCSILLCTDIVRKQEQKLAQAKKNRQQRLVGLANAYALVPEKVERFSNSAKRVDQVWVVDDVQTTGATTTVFVELLLANSAIRAALQAKQLVRFVFARA